MKNTLEIKLKLKHDIASVSMLRCPYKVNNNILPVTDTPFDPLIKYPRECLNKYFSKIRFLSKIRFR